MLLKKIEMLLNNRKPLPNNQPITNTTTFSQLNSTQPIMKYDKFCSVCKMAGKPESVFASHFVRESPEPDAKVVCPTLLARCCYVCGIQGHTPKYCPKSNGRTSTSRRITPSPPQTIGLLPTPTKYPVSTVKHTSIASILSSEAKVTIVTPTPKIHSKIRLTWADIKAQSSPAPTPVPTPVPSPTPRKNSEYDAIIQERKADIAVLRKEHERLTKEMEALKAEHTKVLAQQPPKPQHNQKVIKTAHDIYSIVMDVCLSEGNQTPGWGDMLAFEELVTA